MKSRGQRACVAADIFMRAFLCLSWSRRGCVGEVWGETCFQSLLKLLITIAVNMRGSFELATDAVAAAVVVVVKRIKIGT